MRLFIYLLIYIVVFVAAFSLEFKFGFFRELSLAAVDYLFRPDISFVSLGSLHSFTFVLSGTLLFAFTISLPLADYLIQRLNINRKNKNHQVSWKRSLFVWCAFVMGIVAAYGWIYFMFYIMADIKNDPNARVVLPQLLSYLVGKQWLFGLLAWAFWMLIYKKWFSNARTS